MSDSPINKMTRLVIIDHRLTSGHRGIVFEGRNAKIDLSVQDDGRTLKAFVTDPLQGGSDDDNGQDEAKAERSTAIRLHAQAIERLTRERDEARAEVERLTAEVARLRAAVEAIDAVLATAAGNGA